LSVAINDKCIRCGACEWECPNQAISPGALRPVVDADRCTECYGFFGESQCIVVCPVQAIFLTERETIDKLTRRFERLHPGVIPEDTSIWRRIGS
jgi:ferredoxin